MRSQPALQVLDVGCGIGGSSRHLARKYGATTTGITLSPVQAKRGQALAAEQGLGDRCSFQVLGACEPSCQSTLVLCMPSSLVWHTLDQCILQLSQ